MSESCGGFCWFQEARVGLNGGITFDTVVAVGGGGLKVVSKTGITTVTDAGAAGRNPIYYNPTTEVAYYNFTPAGLGPGFYATNGAVSGVAVAGSWEFFISTVTVDIRHGVGALLQGTTGGLTETGWFLAKGVTIVDDEFTGVCWAVGNMGVKWQGVIGLGGGLALLANSRGGIVELLSVAVMQPTYLYQGNYCAIDRADLYRMYMRWSAEEAAAANKFVGLNVTVGGVTDYIGIQMDTLGAPPLDVDFCFVGGQAGAGITVDTTDTYDTDMKIWEIIPSGTSMTLYRNGTLVATLTTAQYPLAGVQMQVVASTVCLGASVNSQLHIDRIAVVQSRNTGVGDV